MKFKSEVALVMNNLETERSKLKDGVKKVLSKFKSNVVDGTIDVVKEASNRNLQVINFV